MRPTSSAARFACFSLLTSIVVLGRIMPHPYNFAPVAAVSLFGGFLFRNYLLACAAPLVGMVISDWLLGAYSWGIMAVVYSGMCVPVLFLWQRDRGRFGWFPVLALNLIMLSFLSLDIFYYYELRSPTANHVNIHTIFWGMLGGMALFVLAFETVWPTREAIDPDEATDHIPWQKWLVTTAAIFGGIIVAAGYTNSEITMKSANTRFPPWSWRDGPPPAPGEQTSPEGPASERER